MTIADLFSQTFQQNGRFWAIITHSTKESVEGGYYSDLAKAIQAALDTLNDLELIEHYAIIECWMDHDNLKCRNPEVITVDRNGHMSREFGIVGGEILNDEQRDFAVEKAFTEIAATRDLRARSYESIPE